MEIIRKIQDTEVLVKQGWHDAAKDLIAWEWSLASEAELHGKVLSDGVVAGQLSVEDLRGGVVWANAHDREATMVLGACAADAIHVDDQIEATARRLAHHSGKWALQQTGTEIRRLGYQARNRQAQLQLSQQKLGRFMLEGKDLGLDSSRIRIIG